MTGLARFDERAAHNDEIAELEEVYDRFLRRETVVPGKDFCDMAGDYGRFEDE